MSPVTRSQSKRSNQVPAVTERVQVVKTKRSLDEPTTEQHTRKRTALTDVTNAQDVSTQNAKTKTLKRSRTEKKVKFGTVEILNYEEFFTAESSQTEKNVKFRKVEVLNDEEFFTAESSQTEKNVKFRKVEVLNDEEFFTAESSQTEKKVKFGKVEVLNYEEFFPAESSQTKKKVTFGKVEVLNDEEFFTAESNPTSQDLDVSSYTTADESTPMKDASTQTNSGKRMKNKNLEPLPNVTPKKDLPTGVPDYDYENWRDPFSASCYAMDIFNYLKEREQTFAVKKYLGYQPRVSKKVRAILVDWLVEVQEGYLLNHESLYLSVKLVDMFLARTSRLPRELLQLVGATAIFIACKFFERCSATVDDFLYICDDAYNRKQMIAMEVHILRTVNFDIGAPLSYTFLRRYARCASLSMETLTLARYILETSLMSYDLIVESESKLAAAALLLTLRIKKSGWTPLLQYYSGYHESQLQDLVKTLNDYVYDTRKPKATLFVIRKKYSHEEFFEVAKSLQLLPRDG